MPKIERINFDGNKEKTSSINEPTKKETTYKPKRVVPINNGPSGIESFMKALITALKIIFIPILFIAVVLFKLASSQDKPRRRY